MVSPAARAIANGLPEAVAAAVLEFITGDLLREPRRVGKPLQRELGAAGRHAGAVIGCCMPSTSRLGWSLSWRPSTVVTCIGGADPLIGLPLRPARGPMPTT